MAIETGKIGVHIEADYSKFIDDVAKAGDIFEASMHKMQREAGETQKKLEEFAKHYGISVQEVKQVIDRIKKDQDDEYKRNVERERIAQNNRRLELQYYNDRISAVRNLGMAMAGLVASQMTINKFFDWSKNLTSLDQFSKIVGTATDKVIAFRNAARENNVDENSSYNALSRANDYNYNLRYNIGAMSKEDRILAAYNSELTRSTDKNGREYDSTDRLIQQSRALQKFGEMNPQDNIMKRHLAMYYANGDAALAEMLLSGKIENEIHGHMGQGKSIAKGIENARKVMQNKTKIENEKGVIESDAFNNISPIAIKFMEEFNKFLANHEAMSAYIVNFAQFVLLIGTLTSLLKSIPGIGGGLINALAGNGGQGEGRGGPGNIKNHIKGEGAAFLKGMILSGGLKIAQDGYNSWMYNQPIQPIFDVYTPDYYKNHPEEYKKLPNKLKKIIDSGGNITSADIYSANTWVGKKLDNASDWIKNNANPFNWIFPSAHGEERHTDPYSRREDAPTLKNTRDTPNASINDKQAYLRSLEQKYGLPAGILDAQWNKESGRGKHLLSKAGAQGDYQFMKATAREYGVNVNDFYSSASGAARYLTDLKRKFGSIEKALAAYNWGTGNLQKDLKRHGNQWFAYLPDETRNYVRDIMAQQAIASNNTYNNTAHYNYSINVHVTGKNDGKTLAEEIRRHLPGPSIHATQTANGLS
ncbi:MAG: hypothetical protein [Caudoviricetes sp.]|nr:MAG: hypothetical protein [Caudoviricetes sp.]